MSDMINCQISVIMTAFTPSDTTGAPAVVSAAMEITGQTPSPDAADPYFTLNGDSLVVNVPQGTPAAVEYKLVNKTGSTDLFYIFGMFFTFSPKQVKDNIGAFPLVLISGQVPVEATMNGLTISPDTYTATVVDQNDRSGSWEYTIGIQDLNTGVIGLFDPDIENEQ